MGWSLPTNAANCISQQLEQQNALLTHEKQFREFLCSGIAKDFLALESSSTGGAPPATNRKNTLFPHTPTSDTWRCGGVGETTPIPTMGRQMLQVGTADGTCDRLREALRVSPTEWKMY
ncbi:hypothetical protein HW132_23300 [Brasilonema sp. CT11]|nr:hypothetical protein [Brasilonema sp. CT11]